MLLAGHLAYYMRVSRLMEAGLATRVEKWVAAWQNPPKYIARQQRRACIERVTKG